MIRNGFGFLGEKGRLFNILVRNLVSVAGRCRGSSICS
jgi:hypothetical protein